MFFRRVRACYHDGDGELRMRRHTVIGVFLLLSAFSVLTTCQLQLNQSKGLSLRVVNVPKASPVGRGVLRPVALPAPRTSLVQAEQPWS